MSNRREWEQKGERIVQEYLATFQKESGKMERRRSRYVGKIHQGMDDSSKETSVAAMDTSIDQVAMSAIKTKIEGTSPDAMDVKKFRDGIVLPGTLTDSQRLAGFTSAVDC